MTTRLERGALIALLQDRPSGTSWRQLTDEVADCGSAVEVYDRHVALDLFADPGGYTQRFEKGAADIDKWAVEGISVHTMLDETFPPQLRDVLHMPPVVFTRGKLES